LLVLPVQSLVLHLEVTRRPGSADLFAEPKDRVEPFEFDGRMRRIEFGFEALAHIKGRLGDLGIGPGSFAWPIKGARPNRGPDTVPPARLTLLCHAAAILLAIALSCSSVAAQSGPPAETLDRNQTLLALLVKSYPEFLDRADGNDAVWKDGTRMAFDDGNGPKDFETMLDDPDLEDMFYTPYPKGRSGTPPAFNSDPGRVRVTSFFNKMYGDCSKGEVAGNLAEVSWLPSHGAQKLTASRVNSVAEKLQAVSNELDMLPAKFIKYLKPSAGTYNCRPVAGTNRISAHAHGIAIDVSIDYSDYWYWTKPDSDGRYTYKNRLPWEIVEIFEKHGFIWGGKWYHYDTMHFEYRPEIVGASR
jgi:hypothetical protein